MGLCEALKVYCFDNLWQSGQELQIFGLRSFNYAQREMYATQKLYT